MVEHSVEYDVEPMVEICGVERVVEHYVETNRGSRSGIK